MKPKDESKLMAVKSRLVEDRLIYCKLRNQVSKLNRRKKNEMGKKENACASFVESDGIFLIKPQDCQLF